MRIVLLALAILASTGCGGLPKRPGSAPPTPAPGLAPVDPVSTGAGLYAQYCASCHGVAARGDGPAAASLRTPPSDLTSLSARWGSPLDEQATLAAFIDGRDAPRAHGAPDMPVWGERLYAGERIESPAREAARRGTILLILEYLDTLQESAGTPPR